MLGSMNEVRWMAGMALATAISCGGRTPLSTGDETGFQGPADPGHGSGDDDMGRGNSQRGPSGSSTTTTGTGMGGPSSGVGGSMPTGGFPGTGGSSTSGTGTGTAGTSSTGPGSAGGSTGVACATAAGTELIDDMNDGNRFIPSINGRTGAWTVYHDETPAPIHPDITDPFNMDPTGDPCRLSAARVFGGPFSVWGAGFGFGLGNPYDAKAYTGVAFWGRSGGPPTGLQIAFPDRDTALNGGLCDPSLNGGNGCYDHYSARRPLSPQWQRYEIRFTELVQLGFGRHGQSFDPSSLFEIQFLIPQNTKFDVWIDDVSFLTR